MTSAPSATTSFFYLICNPTTLPNQPLEILRVSGVLFTMATMTMTMPASKKTAKKNSKQVPESERFMRACSDIANALIQDYESQRDPSKPKKDVNLNKLRGTISRKHALATQPPLTAIIAAVPEHYKKYILPKLIAKPIRKSLVSSEADRTVD